MSAIGEIFVLLLYALLGSSAIICVIMTFLSKRKRSGWLYFIGFISSAALLFLYDNYRRSSHRTAELEYTGKYYLTNFPGCKSCELVLKEDNSFEVRNGRQVVETGDWRYESGGDFWIVYMNNGNDQLGNERFAYEKYDNGHSNSMRR